MAKQLVFSDEARRGILEGVTLLSKAVKATLGPKGRNVVIDKKFGAPAITKDGVTVAKEIELDDKFENMGAQLVKEVSTKTNDVAGVKEIQIDCDWTMRTRTAYYRFLKQLRDMVGKDGIRLSATIRLHQLSQPAPPVDRGVLMMYNTGDFTDLECSKPILDMDDAAPYMSSLASYNLPLASAYPLFSWRILFRGSRYVGIMHADDDLPVLAGDSIVERRVELDDIMRAKDAVSRKRADANGEILLFDMSNQNITRFKPEDYEKIYLR